MTENPYDVDLDPHYNGPGTRPAAWDETRSALAGAELYWIVTVRPGPGPHLTPVAGAWHEGALWFVSLPRDRKVRNLLSNPRCALLTGTNRISSGVDLVLEGRAVRITGEKELEEAAEVFRRKYGPPWDYVVDGDVLSGSPGRAWAFSVAPETVFAFGKDRMTQTRWRFSH